MPGVGMNLKGFVFKPCFHENKLILVPLGHRGFKKVIFRCTLANFLFSLRFFVICFTLHFQYIFSKNIGKHAAVEPPVFEEIAAH